MLNLDRPAPRASANVIVSLYDKPAFAVQGWIKDGLLRYAHQGKTRRYFQSARLQLPREGSNAGNKKLRTEDDLVKFRESTGLRASGLPASFTKPVPPARIGPLVTVATKYLAEGINTPEALAERLGALAEGKMRPFTQSIWFAFKMAGVEGAAEPDWAGVYASTNQDASDENGLRTDEGAGHAAAGEPSVATATAPPADTKAYLKSGLRAAELPSRENIDPPENQNQSTADETPDRHHNRSEQNPRNLLESAQSLAGGSGGFYFGPARQAAAVQAREGQVKADVRVGLHLRSKVELVEFPERSEARRELGVLHLRRSADTPQAGFEEKLRQKIEEIKGAFTAARN